MTEIEANVAYKIKAGFEEHFTALKWDPPVLSMFTDTYVICKWSLIFQH